MLISNFVRIYCKAHTHANTSDRNRGKSVASIEFAVEINSVLVATTTTTAAAATIIIVVIIIIIIMCKRSEIKQYNERSYWSGCRRSKNCVKALRSSVESSQRYAGARFSAAIG